MIYVCNFYVHAREGVSNQIELLRARTDGHLFAAGIFMEQAHLAYEDITQKRIILSEEAYIRELPSFLRSLPANEAIHYFSEEPEPDKATLFNAIPNDLYVTMYRRPDEAYATYLKGLRTLVRVYVELDSHRVLIEEFGIDPWRITVSAPPSMLTPPAPDTTPRVFAHRYLFASWNGGSATALEERGLVAILDLLASDPEGVCTVLLRDRETALYERMIAERGLANRVILAEVSTRREVEDAFNATDVVLFLMQRKVTKDVPNSIIDGFVLGKPVLMTSVVDLAEVVRARGLGWVVEPGDAIDVRTIAATYDASCQNAAAYAEGMTPGRYVETVTAGYRA